MTGFPEGVRNDAPEERPGKGHPSLLDWRASTLRAIASIQAGGMVLYGVSLCVGIPDDGIRLRVPWQNTVLAVPELYATSRNTVQNAFRTTSEIFRTPCRRRVV